MGRRVKDLLKAKKPLVRVSPDTPVLDAARMMAAENVGAVLVLDDQSRLVGIFTERDLLRRVVIKGLDPSASPIRDAMTTEVIVANVRDTHDQVLQIMNRTKCRHIPVVDGEELVGVVSMRDLLRYDNDEKAFEMSQLRSYFFHGG